MTIFASRQKTNHVTPKDAMKFFRAADKAIALLEKCPEEAKISEPNVQGAKNKLERVTEKIAQKVSPALLSEIGAINFFHEDKEYSIDPSGIAGFTYRGAQCFADSNAWYTSRDVASAISNAVVLGSANSSGNGPIYKIDLMPLKAAIDAPLSLKFLPIPNIFSELEARADAVQPLLAKLSDQLTDSIKQAIRHEKVRVAIKGIDAAIAQINRE